MYEYNCLIARVVDGDTVDVKIDLGFEVWVNQRVRLAGVDTPESRTRDLREKKYGKLATVRVKELMPVRSKQIIRTRKDGRGKFGRVLADFMDEGDSLCDHLIRERLAVVYEGQSKADVRAEHEANYDWLEAQETLQ